MEKTADIHKYVKEALLKGDQVPLKKLSSAN